MTKVVRLDFNREKQVLVNLIVDTTYCKEVLKYAKEEYFKSQHASKLLQWVKAYFDSYGVAPKHQILDIFEQEKAGIDNDVNEQISNVLQCLDSTELTDNHNTQYLVDNAIDLFREKHLAMQIETARDSLSSGSVLGAETALAEAFEFRDMTSKWVKFEDEEYIRQVVRQMVVKQDLETAFFKFDGRLGEFIGPIERGWFIAFLAPAKKGKTTYLMETIIAAIRQKRNVIFLSLEMPVNQLYARYLLSTVGQKPEVAEYDIDVPVMDCLYNQHGTCKKDDIRVGIGQLVDEEGNIQAYSADLNWDVCTECRGTSDFEPYAWKAPVRKEYIDEGTYVKRAVQFSQLFGKYCRAIHIPSKTATVQELKQEVQYIVDSENFIPDLIVIDYADLIKPEKGSGVKRHDLDDVWEGIRAWGQEDNVLMVSASQTNRTSATAAYMMDTHVAEDYSKIAKLDIAIGLCQNDVMKVLGMMNLNKVAHRHNEYVQSHTCTVLQELSHQQAVLDSEFRIA